MKKRQELQLRLMTYNIGGGRKDFGSKLGDVIEVIEKAQPDILAVQEATEFQDADGAWHRILSRIAQAGKLKHTYFGPTLSMREHVHVRKDLFVHGIFDDWQDWRQGNAILSRWEFVRLGDPSKPGVPRNVPLYLTPLYQGSRDTDPRYVLLARINKPPLFPFVVGVHFTTLVAEREREGGPRPLPGRFEEAQVLRFKQAKRLLDLLREHVLKPGEMVFLLGDFNAMPDELCISSVLKDEGGFVRLAPEEGPGATHPKAPEPIDHIFVYPENRLIKEECHCRIVGDERAQRASDHLPV
ncbi:MAG: endonuclease/exonuclease/phosphatase family protein, partial [Candidatus Thorarchaeota archaeon]